MSRPKPYADFVIWPDGTSEVHQYATLRQWRAATAYTDARCRSAVPVAMRLGHVKGQWSGWQLYTKPTRKIQRALAAAGIVLGALTP